MAKYTASVSGDTTSSAIKVYNARGAGGNNSIKTVSVTGTFSSGTAALQMSTDLGLTWFAVNDSAGAVTFAANGAKNLQIISDSEAPVQLRISVSGSSGSAALVFTVYEDR